MIKFIQKRNAFYEHNPFLQDKPKRSLHGHTFEHIEPNDPEPHCSLTLNE